MSITYRRWSGLGLGAALAGGAFLSGCGESEPAAPASTETQAPGNGVEAAAPADASAPGAVGEMGEGEGGEGGEGEGGEGGVNVALAGSDPVEYLSALAITRAHAIAARDAYAIGNTQAAGEMFAHPVSEVLIAMEPVFEARGVAPFDSLLGEASAAVFDGESVEDINARTLKIFQALDRAAAKAPGSEMSAGRIAAGLVADQISRAIDLYRGAEQSGAYEPYLDGYGYYLTAQMLFDRQEAAIKEAAPDGADAMVEAFGLLETAFPSAAQPETLKGDASALAVADSQIQLALSQ